MKERPEIIVARIFAELALIEQVVKRGNLAYRHAHGATKDDDLFLDAVALNLHSFYSGVEKVLLQIARGIDESIPTGEQWHRELLSQMKIEIPGVRPAVLSHESVSCLHEYLSFRHLVRNVYTFVLDSKKLEKLVAGLSGCFETVKHELKIFLNVIVNLK